MSFALPSSLNYSTLPSSLGEEQTRVVQTPTTGAISYYSGTQDFLILNVPKVSNNALFDPQNTYIKFALNMPGSASGTIQGDVSTIFQRMEVYCGSEILETVQNYDILESILLDSQLAQTERQSSYGVSRGTSIQSTVNCSQLFLGENLSGVGTAVCTKYYTCTLISGFVGSLATHLIPTYALNDNISIRLTLSPSARGMLATASANWYINNIEMHCNFVNVKPEILAAITPSDGVFRWNTSSYSSFQIANASATTVIDALIPFKYSSLKSLFFSMCPQLALTTAKYPINNRYSYNLYDYAVRIGATQIPATRCRNYQDCIETFYECQKAFHVSPNSINAFGCHDKRSFSASGTLCPGYYSDGSNGAFDGLHTPGGTFFLATNLEPYVAKNDQVLQGISTKLDDIFFSATFSSGVPEQFLLNAFAHYDILVTIANGVLTAHS